MPSFFINSQHSFYSQSLQVCSPILMQLSTIFISISSQHVIYINPSRREDYTLSDLNMVFEADKTRSSLCLGFKKNVKQNHHILMGLDSCKWWTWNSECSVFLFFFFCLPCLPIWAPITDKANDPFWWASDIGRWYFATVSYMLHLKVVIKD